MNNNNNVIITYYVFRSKCHLDLYKNLKFSPQHFELILVVHIRGSSIWKFKLLSSALPVLLDDGCNRSAQLMSINLHLA